MSELFVFKAGGSLVPASAGDRETMNLLPERRVFTIVSKAEAPPKLKRWYRACLHVLAQGLGLDRQALHVRIMLRAGRIDSVVIAGDGSTRFNPQSTAEWEITDWRRYLDDAMPIIAELAGETGGQIRRRVDDFLGLRYREAYEE